MSSTALRMRISRMRRLRAASSPLSARCVRCASIASIRWSMPSRFCALVATTGTFHAEWESLPSEPSLSMARRSATVSVASMRSHLLTTWMSAISRPPALIAWISSPRPGAETTTTLWAACTTSTSSWPTPTVSTKMTSNPAASSTSTTARVARASPPSAPGVAMLRMNTPGSRARSRMRIRSPGMAPPEKGLDGSTATMPTVRPLSRYFCANARTIVDLPLPGTPVIPMTWARPVWRCSSASAGLPAAPLDSASDISRAMLLRLPARTSATRASGAAPAGARATASAMPRLRKERIGGEIILRERHVTRRELRQRRPVLVGQPADRLRRRTGPELAALHTLAGRDQRAGRHHRSAFDQTAVHDRRPHADEAAVLQRAGVQQRHVADGDIGADEGPLPFLGDMHHRAVLDVRAFADAHHVHVAAHDTAEPDAGLRADLDVADHGRARRDEYALADAGQDPPVGQKRGRHPHLSVTFAASSAAPRSPPAAAPSSRGGHSPRSRPACRAVSSRPFPRCPQAASGRPAGRRSPPRGSGSEPDRAGCPVDSSAAVADGETPPARLARPFP